MLSLKDSEDLFDLEFHRFGSKKEKFIDRIEALAKETDKALAEKAVSQTQKTLSFVNYLFTHSGQYLQLTLVDHFFKKLKNLRCKLLYSKKIVNRGASQAAILTIRYRLLHSKYENKLTLITIQNK